MMQVRTNCALAGEKAGEPALIYAGDESLQHKGIQVLWGGESVGNRLIEKVWFYSQYC